jgi:hypothetical protein
VRGFSTGGLAGAFDALGPAIKQALGALGSFALDITIDIGKWIIGKLPSMADWLDTLFGGNGATPAGDGTQGPDGGGVNHVTLSTLAVDILGFAAGKVADLWGWVKGLFGVGGVSATGDGTGGPDTDNVITLSDVAVSIAGWVISKAADIGSDIVRFLAATAVNLASVAVSVGSWVISTAADLGPEIVRFLAATAVELKTFALSLGVPTIANATSDVNSWLQGWLDAHQDVKAAVTNWTLVFNDPTQVTLPDTGKAGTDAAANKSTIVLIKDWYLQVQGDPKMTPEQEAQTNASIGDFFSKLKTKVTLGKIVMDNPVGQFSLALNNVLNQDMPVLVTLAKWGVDLGSSDPVVSSGKLGGGPAGWSLWLGGKIAEKIGNVNVSLPSWSLDLPNPTIGNALIGSIELGMAIGPMISEKIGNLHVPLPSWNLNVPTPSLDVFPTIADLVALTNDGLVALGVLTNDWPNDFHLNVSTPDLGSFPSWNDIFNVVWGGLKGLGDLSVPWPNAFHLDIPLPSIGSFPSWNDIWNLIWGQLMGLGSFTFGLPVHINVNPFANGGVVPGFANGGVIPRFANGGRVVMVGERGPELAAMPVGTRIFNHADTMNMLRNSQGGGDTYNIDVQVIAQPGMDEEAMAASVGRSIVRELQLRATG